MRAFGRLMQRVALVIPPVAIVLQLTPSADGKTVLSLGQMLVALLAAVCLFWIGRIIEGYGAT